MAGNIAVKMPNLLKGRSGFNIAHDDQNHIRRRVPLVSELLQHRPRSLVEGGARSQRIVRVGRAREQVLVETIDKFIRWIGEIARDLLLDRPPLLVPLRLRVVDAAHTRRLRLQRHIDVSRRHRLKILRDVLLRVRVVIAAQKRKNGRRLVGRHPLASAKRHVLLRVRHAGITIGRLIPAHHEVGLDRHHRRKRVADNYHPHPIRESRTGDRGFGVGGAEHRRGGKRHQHDQKWQSAQTLQNNPPGRRCPLRMVMDVRYRRIAIARRDRNCDHQAAAGAARESERDRLP